MRSWKVRTYVRRWLREAEVPVGGGEEDWHIRLVNGALDAAARTAELACRQHGSPHAGIAARQAVEALMSFKRIRL